MSCHKAEQKYGITHGNIQKWKRIYLTQGIEGLAIDQHVCDAQIVYENFRKQKMTT